MARQRGQEITKHYLASFQSQVAFPALLLLVLSFTYILWFGAWVRTTSFSATNSNTNTIPFQSNKRYTLNSTVVIPDSVQNHKFTNNTGLLKWQGLQHHLPITSSLKCIQQSSEVDKFCHAYLKKKRCQVPTPERIQPRAAATTSCKTLWFAGFSEGKLSNCPVVGNGTRTGGTGIRMMYAAVLQSAKIYADGVLQPVLLLGRGEGDGAVALQTWALAQGAIVVHVNELSFHNDIATWHHALNITSPDHQMGPYMRMDIPNMIEKHRLFDLPNICPRHILYTDADTLFVNPVSHADMDALKSYMLQRTSPTTALARPWWWQRLWIRYSYEPPIVMYGRESVVSNDKPKNTGVMLMDAPRFQNELPAMVKFRNEHDSPHKFTAFDQNWMNMYFGQNGQRRAGYHLLPLYWNWKIYWSLEPSAFSDVKVVHFHGPKPMLGAWLMADCQFNLTDFPIAPYHSFIRNGICCDRGKTAARIRDFYNHIAPKEQDVC